MVQVLSTWQTFCLMFLFQLGTTVVFGFAGGAKQDAWLAALISALIGISVVWMYTRMYERFPEETLISLLHKTFGRYISKIFTSFYIFAFIYEAGRILRDLGELMETFLLPSTPTPLLMLLLLALVAYACYAGIERIARLAELSIIIVFLFTCTQFILLAFSNVIDFSWLTPVASDWKRIGVTVFPLGITTTFGEMIAFSVFWKLTVRPLKFRKAALFSSLLVGAVFVILDIIAVCTLGPDLFYRSFYPLLTAFQLIRIADFIDNLDPFVVTTFITGGLFKIIIYAYAACTTIAAQWKIDNHRVVIFPISLLIWFISIYTAKNISSHIFVGLKIVPWIIELPLFILIPLIVFIVTGIPKKTSA
ncbi:GerAB/ArcD/ProY family transporter [Paenibacillus sp. LMG 31458]|uniref:GerAB/ArcD/ProY family transporter n=1 Tax=Paenibacillus phytorum TaxID=2654977 RepID=A0ABX1XX56_9BACL|nr:endospore germination permease [Paenibacillus phytorum]NOU73102.1 GerAB/ArcD/ProY family transporter [Paenibacillus phytorum]